MISFVLFVALTTAGELPCPDLPIAPRQTYALAMSACAPELKASCGLIEATLAQCLADKKAKLVTRDGAKMSFDESAFAAPDRAGALAKTIGASQVLMIEVHGSAKEPVALVKLIDTEHGTLIKAARMSAGAKPIKKEIGGLAQALPELADKLAQAVAALPGRKKTLGIMTFAEQGEDAKKNGLGTLVSAELTTRLSRDAGIAIVERARLDQVLREFELGQTGALDPKKAPTLGKMIGADAIVIGSVNAAGAVTKVFAQVVDVLTGATLVAESVDFKSADLVALSSDAVVLRTKSGAVFRSLLIPGWGQLYNRQEAKGYAILTSVLVLGLGGGGLEVLSYLAAENYRRAPAGSNFDQLAQRAETFALAGIISFGVMGVVWIYNLIDAYVNGYTYDSAVKAGGGSLGFTF